MRLLYFLIIIYTLSTPSCRDNKPLKTYPNVVIINIDDMGWKDVGFMGSKYYETPHIDQLSTAGMIFTNGYAAAANCAPSRASLMTGQWSPRHGIYTVNSSERGDARHRKLIPTKNETVLSRNHKILPEVLHENGYKTCHAGKWHLSEDPVEYGFDINLGGGHNGHPGSYYPPYHNIVLQGDEDQYLTDLIMEKTLQFIDSVRSPFFLHYTPYAVHTPIQPVQSLLEKYQQKTGSNGQNNPQYATMVENLDRNIGLLISHLRKRGLFDHTLIVFTSDNGGLYSVTRQHPLRAGKGNYYEGGIREPFFFVFRNTIRENSISNVPISNIDIFPTILHYAGIKSNTLKLDGVDLSPILEGRLEEMERPLYWHFPIYLQAYNAQDNENRDSLFRTRPGSVIRYGDYKLHYYFENNEIELYNLAKDIGERNNIAEKEPQKKEELLDYLREWWDKTDAPIPKERNPDYKE